MKASEIASSASDLVSGDRADAYGDAVEGWQRTADIWNAILRAAGHNIIIDAHTASLMMVGLKISRCFVGPFRADNYVDAAGYAALAGEIASKEYLR